MRLSTYLAAFGRLARRWPGRELAFLLALAAPVAAAAHPHIWIDATATFVFAQDRLVAVRQSWIFDEVFSTVMINQFDRNRDRRFDADELAKLRAGAFASLKNYSFLTRLTVDGDAVDIPDVADFMAEVADGRLVYRFTVRLPAPVDAAARAVELRVFDESYYIDVALNQAEPVRFEGLSPGACGFAIAEEGADLANFGLTPIGRITLQCR